MVSGGALSFARLLSGVVRVKVLALALGASGVGVYALMLQLYVTGVGVVSMSLAVPIINLGRKPAVTGDDGEAGSIAGTALLVVVLNCSLLAALAIFFGNELLAWMGIGPDADGLLLPLTLAVIFGAISGAFWEGMSYLCDRFDAYVKVGLISAITDMVFISAGAMLFGLRGAIFALPFAPLALFVSYSLIVGRDPIARRVLRNLSLRASQLPRLFTYSAIMFTAVAMTQIGLTFLRSLIVIEAGPVANGYLQPATSLAAYILAFVMTGFWGHLHAHAAAAGDTQEVRAELDRALRFGLLIAFTGCGSAAVLADFLIPLFYSANFSPGAQLLTAYMPGELCFQLFSMLVAYQLTVSMRRAYLGLSLGYTVLLVASGAPLINITGAVGYTVAHNIASFSMLAAALTFAVRSGQVERRFASMAVGAVVFLAAIAAVVVVSRHKGYFDWILVPALLPSVFSGRLLLLKLLKDQSVACPDAR
jgi:O-antigen/teichoic acid export membrane protein